MVSSECLAVKRQSILTPRIKSNELQNTSVLKHLTTNECQRVLYYFRVGTHVILFAKSLPSRSTE